MYPAVRVPKFRTLVHFPKLMTSTYLSSENEDIVHKVNISTKNEIFRDYYKKWAIDFNIPHVALKQLNIILNKRFSCIVPLDPRTLLKGTKNIQVMLIDDGNY